jgi:hypothetical protein
MGKLAVPSVLCKDNVVVPSVLKYNIQIENNVYNENKNSLQIIKDDTELLSYLTIID